ncbi:MAG: VTC domain-containing protein [Pirellulales bacterium]
MVQFPHNTTPPHDGKAAVVEVKNKFLASRFELKYVVSEEKARAIKQYLLRFLDPDEYTDPEDNLGYAIHSLYLDSPDLKTCYSVIQGSKNRFKLRLRVYGKQDDPVFFEIKRRDNKVILKERAIVHRSCTDELLEGRWSRPSDLVNGSDSQIRALSHFCELRDLINAKPAAYVSYFREGYEPRESNRCRVTFDRRLRSGKYRETFNVADAVNWTDPKLPGVILELKFTDRFPLWMQDLVEWFDLSVQSVPKYVHCVALVHPEKMKRSDL